MSDAQWAIIKPLLPKAKPGGRPRTVDLREVVNAVFYLNRSGCSWRMLPHDFPPWSTVHWFYRQWRLEGTWERLKACPRHDCFWAFYDHSKNRSGRWCRMEDCGNIEKARAFRERRRTAPA
jgi:putative transposase